MTQEAQNAAARLLIIDDDQGLCELFDLFMTKAGFHVASAADGKLGLAKVAVFRPHLIVLDLMMPNLNGFEVLRELQKGPFATVPVIVATGYGKPANEEIARREANVVDFLVKPIDYSQLAERIRGLLAGRKVD